MLMLEYQAMVCCPLFSVISPLISFSASMSLSFHRFLNDEHCMASGSCYVATPQWLVLLFFFIVVRRSSFGSMVALMVLWNSSFVAWSGLDMIKSCGGLSLQWAVFHWVLQPVPHFEVVGSQTMASLARLTTICKANNIRIKHKMRLMRALVIPIFLYACETWTITAELQRRIQSLECRCFRKILGVS